MVILDLSIVNVALPSIQAGLHFNAADLNWVIDAYAIMFGGFLMLAGRFGDTFGQRKTFVAALTVFGLASLLGGLAPTSLVLIVARAIQGFGGALMAASSLGIITATFTEAHERRRAISLWSSMNGIGGAAGVLLSGVITQYLSWRWVLLINVPIGIVTVFVAAAVVTDRRAAQRPRFDIAGAVLLTFGLLVEAYGAVTAGNDGWGSAAALIPLIGGAILLNFFPLIEKRAVAPLVPPKAFTRPLRVVNLIVLLFSAALFPMWYIGSLYLQQVLSLSPIDTGLIFLPPALVIFACASQAGKLVGRAGVKTGARWRPAADDRGPARALADQVRRERGRAGDDPDDPHHRRDRLLDRPLDDRRHPGGRRRTGRARLGPGEHRAPDRRWPRPRGVDLDRHPVHE